MARKKCEEENECLEGNSNIFLLGIATSLDALAIGFSFSLVPHLNIFSVVLEIGLITFFISAVGVYMGNKFGNILGYKAEYFGGIILILIAFKTLISEFI